ncbi:PleD family two-component system response regulator [Ochrobactrum sp. Marseille-Q0166]|uniref:PleD family two-component system response regulator n=1 Tax=Ochrobactrum sp. Marseille-Q0166 TaxID=2761105 RepID=UPI0016551C5E|nr:PleD family two-component system response regulator [Ochrobactrum sp. Marseille-Q0166]MBC8719052.1 PleD family two-component system response regulator [Ochrobactrum sp. Marseille-Q0166]
MTARILVVDDVESNVRLLEALLLREYYEVISAYNGTEAIEICLGGQIDVVILDVLLPGIDGFEVCRRLKEDPRTTNIPIVILTALNSAQDKIAGLEAGADDFMTKPVNDIQLLSRVKSLARLKMVSDELFQRTGTVADTEVEALLVTKLSGRFGGGDDAARILIVDENEIAAARLRTILGEDYFVDVANDANDALIKAIENDYDSIVVSADFTYYDPLRLCSQIRTIERTRLVPIILIVNEDEGSLVVRALELGVNDYVMRPLEKLELYARLRTQIKRKCYNDLLRQSLHRTITMAVTDSLTGLHNRRYLDTHMPVLLSRATGRERPLSVIMIDFDHFKRVNDQYGHDGGDDVLREFAARLRKKIRGMDVMCRYGGEEFAIVLPDTDLAASTHVAERILEAVSEKPFLLAGGKHQIDMTISIGIASLRLMGADTVEALFARTDAALYEAKTKGRNRIALSAA